MPIWDVTEGTVPALLELKEVSAGYGPITALRGVSLHVERGEIVTLIGANGAGKSTALKVISQLLPMTSGDVLFEGASLRAHKTHSLVALGIAHVPEGRKIFSRLTVQENLEMGAFSRRDAHAIRRDMDRVLSLFPILAERRGQSGGTLSGGEQQMLAIGRALMAAPRLLLLDEPSMGVAPIIVARIFETLRQLNAEGLSMLLVEQNAYLALTTASRAYVLESGQVTLAGESGSLLGNQRVRSAYLGEQPSGDLSD